MLINNIFLWMNGNMFIEKTFNPQGVVTIFY